MQNPVAVHDVLKIHMRMPSVSADTSTLRLCNLLF